MTNDEIVAHWTLQMEFLQSRYDTNSACELDGILWNWLHFSRPSSPCPAYQNRLGVKTSTLLNYLNERTSIYLNLMIVDEAEASLSAFETCIQDRWPYDHLLVYHFILKADLRHRQGNNKEAEEILNGIIPYATLPMDLSIAHRLLGSIESDRYRFYGPVAMITNLSQSLGYAEQSGDRINIAKSYAQLGHAFHRQYPALALSMQWQAQVMAEKNNDVYLAVGTKLQRAYSDIQMLFAKNGRLPKPELFKQDAEQIVGSLNRESLPTESLKAFYDETSAYVLGKDEPMERALKYYQQHGAWEKVYEMAENIGGRAIFAKDDVKVRRMLELCIEAARQMNDPLLLERAQEGLRMFKNQPKA